MISRGKKVNFEWTEWGPVQVSHGQVIGGPGVGALTILIAMMKNAGVEKLLSFPVHPAPYERRLFAAWWKIWAKEIFTFSQAQGS